MLSGVCVYVFFFCKWLMHLGQMGHCQEWYSEGKD